MNSDLFSADFFVANRRRLRELANVTAPIVLTASGLLQRNGDNAFPFQQDSSFWYFTGISEPDIMLVIDKDEEYLIVPGREASRAAFDGTLDDDLFRRTSGVRTVLSEDDGWRRLTDKLHKTNQVATMTPPPRYVEHYGLYTNPARARMAGRLKKLNADLELVDLREHVAHMRMVKQAPELEALQRAIDITIDGITHATSKAMFNKYEYEFELEAELSRTFRRSGANGHAFAPIVAGGLRACTMHNVSNEAPLSAKDLVVIDVGAEYCHYAADITRTVIAGRPTKRQRAVHEAVVATQEYAISLLKPGVMLREYESQVEQFSGEKMRELGLIKTLERGEIRRFFPHATSHFLGLDVHDIGDYNLPLEPGMVLTCEPGIYIPEESIGVRIEDDILITKKGAKVLSERLPRSLS